VSSVEGSVGYRAGFPSILNSRPSSHPVSRIDHASRIFEFVPHRALIILSIKEKKYESVTKARRRFGLRMRPAYLGHLWRRQHILDARAGQARRRQDARSAP